MEVPVRVVQHLIITLVKRCLFCLLEESHLKINVNINLSRILKACFLFVLVFCFFVCFCGVFL